MPQAIVDPEHLRQFAGALRAFTDELQQRSSSLGSQMIQLSQTWRDQQHHKFAAEFEDQLRQLARFLEGTRSHVPYLLRKADEIDAYLRG
jgi:uncharacterized protein YukE